VRDGRERVMRVACELFVERGFAEVSMQQIADAAGMRKASLYHHFRDKRALFVQVVLLELESMRQEMEGLAAEGGTLEEQLTRLARAHFGRFRPDVMMRLARDFQAHVPEEYHEEIHCDLEALAGLFGGVFRRAAEAGELRDYDPNVLGLLFYHMVAAWAFHGAEDPALLPPDPETAARTVTDIILRGVAAPHRPADRSGGPSKQTKP
jgi:AcrR family transcriptional regulator